MSNLSVMQVYNFSFEKYCGLIFQSIKFIYWFVNKYITFVKPENSVSDGNKYKSMK